MKQKKEVTKQFKPFPRYYPLRCRVGIHNKTEWEVDKDKDEDGDEIGPYRLRRICHLCAKIWERKLPQWFIEHIRRKGNGR